MKWFHDRSSGHAIRSIAAAIALCIGAPVLAQTATAGDPSLVPASTISSTWAQTWKGIIARRASEAAPPAPDDVAAWVAQQQKLEHNMAAFVQGAIAAYKVKVTDGKLGGTPVLTIEPSDWRDDGRVLIYVHGGGFTSLSARSTLFSSALMASRTGLKVISVDYTLAPSAHWQRITDQAIAVYRAVLAQGYRPDSIGMWGDSAGGSIVAGSVLKLRDAGTPMPGALILWAPWADVSGAGDTYHTLAAFDPMLKLDSLKVSAAAYAALADQTNPYVSPVYGDYEKGFPPTLIQCGTREIFLSNCVREYQAISMAHRTAVLDVYEGMPHVFEPMSPSSPETTQAMYRVKRFWDAHLHTREVH